MKKLNRNLGMILVILIPLVGVILLAFSPGVNMQVNSVGEAMTLLGKVFGVLGMMLFAESLILSARTSLIEDFFYGLNRVYIRHNQIGQIGFILMLFHPLLLLYKYTDMSFGRVISFFTPSQYTPANNFGQFALYFLIILIGLTLYFRPKYNIWKWTHKFMGLAFFLASMHVFFVSSDTSRFLPLRLYVLVVSGVALYAYLYHSIFGRYTTKKYVYLISGVKDLGSNITEIKLKPTAEKIIFAPGQFAFISFNAKNISKESHPFSFSSSDASDEISFTIKNLGDWTSDVKNLLLGTLAHIEGPFGKFQASEGEFKRQIWIAGGIGITPFLSMAKSLKNEDGYNIDLYYCVKNKVEAVYLSELESMNVAGLKIIPFYSEAEGYITADIVNRMSGNLVVCSIFICAPVSMLRSLRKQFVRLSVQESNIHSEEFSL